MESSNNFEYYIVDFLRLFDISIKCDFPFPWWGRKWTSVEFIGDLYLASCGHSQGARAPYICWPPLPCPRPGTPEGTGDSCAQRCVGSLWVTIRPDTTPWVESYGRSGRRCRSDRSNRKRDAIPCRRLECWEDAESIALTWWMTGWRTEERPTKEPSASPDARFQGFNRVSRETGLRRSCAEKVNDIAERWEIHLTITRNHD